MIQILLLLYLNKGLNLLLNQAFLGTLDKFMFFNLNVLLMLSFYENCFFFFFKISLIKSNIYGFYDFLQISFRGMLVLLPISTLISEAIEALEALKDKELKEKKKVFKEQTKTLEKLNLKLSEGKRELNVSGFSDYKSQKIYEIALTNKKNDAFRIRGSLFWEEKMDFFRVQSTNANVLKQLNIVKKVTFRKKVTPKNDEKQKLEQSKKAKKFKESLKKMLDKEKRSENYIHTKKINYLSLLKEKFWLYRKLNQPIHYIKNVFIYALIIFGMRSKTQNMYLVFMIQTAYLLWLGFSVEKEKKTSVWFIIQESYFHLYLFLIMFYFNDYRNSYRINLIALAYFFGILFSIFIAITQILNNLVINPLKLKIKNGLSQPTKTLKVAKRKLKVN